MCNDNTLEREIEKFYNNLSDVAKKQGYLLDIEKEEALPLSEKGEKPTEEELRNIHGDDIASWKWYYDFFFEDRDPIDYILLIQSLQDRGYEIEFTIPYKEVEFTEMDLTMLSGEVVLKICDRWFAIGRCEDERGKEFFYSAHQGMYYCGPRPQDILVLNLYKPQFVIQNINDLERELPIEKSKKSLSQDSQV